MSTLISQSELLRRAVAFVLDERRDYPNRSLHAVLDDAGMRFNLTPLDYESLQRFFVDAPKNTE